MTDIKALKELRAAVEAGEWDCLNETFPMPAEVYVDFGRAYEGSLDAAIQLLEAVLPGWGYSLEWRDDGFVMAYIGPNLNRITDRTKRKATKTFWVRNYSGSVPCALLLAIIDALIAKGESE